MREIVGTVIDVLKKNGVVACPTETVFGLIGRAFSEHAVNKIFEIKKREKLKTLPCFVKDVEMALTLLRDVSEYGEKLMRSFWPGPLTVVGYASLEAPRLCVSKDNKIGIRIPNEELLLEVLSLLNEPLASTSANISGEPPFRDSLEVEDRFGKVVDFIVRGVSGDIPSTVVDITGENPLILRKGSLSFIEIEKITGREVKFSPSENILVVFLCTGNTCRSPMAEAIFKKELGVISNLKFASRGIVQAEDSDIHPYAKEVLKEIGIFDFSHRPQILTGYEMEIADIIIAMTKEHLNWIPEKFRHKGRLMDPGESDIEDPIGGPIATYRFVRDKIRHFLESYWKGYFERKFENRG